MIWILADDRAGNVNQLLGIAESLNQPFERKDIRYNKWVKLPNFLRGSTFIGITKESQKALKGPWPKVVLSAGRRSFPVALAIRRLSGGKTKVVQLMSPGKCGEKKCDLLILPIHDEYKGLGILLCRTLCDFCSQTVGRGCLLCLLHLLLLHHLHHLHHHHIALRLLGTSTRSHKQH